MYCILNTTFRHIYVKTSAILTSTLNFLFCGTQICGMNNLCGFCVVQRPNSILGCNRDKSTKCTKLYIHEFGFCIEILANSRNVSEEKCLLTDHGFCMTLYAFFNILLLKYIRTFERNGRKSFFYVES
jgi:hypothetical protein